jgi:CubicO group peptidase (beta-lactamase class C family)
MKSACAANRVRAVSILAMVAALSGCGSDSSGGAAPPIVATPAPPAAPTPVATPGDLFVNAAPDPGGNTARASAYFGAQSVTGAAKYVFSYAVDGGTATMVESTTPSVTVGNLAAGGRLSVTVASVTAAGATSSPSTAVTATLPAPATAAERARYDNAANYSDSESGEAVVVWKNGMVVYQRYSAGYANTPHPLASGTKSFTCALEAFAEADGQMSQDDKASSVITEWAGDPRKSLITVRDLLSLQSGLTGNPAYSPIGAQTLDTYQLAVDNTASYNRGAAFVYDALSFQTVAMIFQVKSGGVYTGNGNITGGTDPVDYLQTKLFTPIGIPRTSQIWQRDIEGRPQMAGGASFTATDWVKFGQFMLQRGTWQSTRLLEAARLDQCTGGYINPAYKGYGLTWWLNAHSAGTVSAIDSIPPDGQPLPGFDQVAPNAPADMYLAAGLGKQRLYIVPSQNLIVARFAPIAAGSLSDWSDDTFLGKILGTLP